MTPTMVSFQAQQVGGHMKDADQETFLCGSSLSCVEARENLLVMVLKMGSVKIKQNV